MPSLCTEAIVDTLTLTTGLKVSQKPRLVVMGAANVGKTAIIQQFLYDRFPSEYVPTVEEMYRSHYEVSGSSLTLEILDTSGSYEFPAMRRLAIQTANAFILVYSIDNPESFEEVSTLREQILDIRQEKEVPIVVVGNKCDLENERKVKPEIAETVVSIDWENGFIEASAKTGVNIVNIFKEVLDQAHICYALGKAVERRRRSLPAPSSYTKYKQPSDQKRHSCTLQ